MTAVPSSLVNVLIVCDNFWVGGRETFIRDALEVLRQHGLKRAFLLANSIKSPLAEKLFDDHAEVGLSRKSGVPKWLEASDKLIKNRTVDLVWVHHYRSLPGFFVAQHLLAKLHITLHGPPLTTAPLLGKDALGLTLAIHRGATVSGVSPEVLSQIQTFSSDTSHQILLANRVVCPVVSRDQCDTGNTAFTTDRPLNLTLLTRQGKLEHIRAASKLFAKFCRLGVPCTLTIHTGITQQMGLSSHIMNQSTLRRSLLGRKWLILNPGVWLILNKIKFKPLTNDVQKVIEATDIVLGMGRVVLEGLANGKVAILIGYNSVIGVINSENFADYQRTNFSGRNQKAMPLTIVAKQGVKQLSSGNDEFDALRSLVDIKNAWPQFETWLRKVDRSSPLKQCRLSLAEINAFDSEDFIQTKVEDGLLSTEERTTLHRLVNKIKV